MESPRKKQVWMNEVCCRGVKKVEDGEDEPAPDWKPILDSCEPYWTKEDRVVVPHRWDLIVTGMVDVHSNRLEIYWKAWAKNWGELCVEAFGD